MPGTTTRIEERIGNYLSKGRASTEYKGLSSSVADKAYMTLN